MLSEPQVRPNVRRPGSRRQPLRGFGGGVLGWESRGVEFRVSSCGVRVSDFRRASLQEGELKLIPEPEILKQIPRTRTLLLKT